jgi:serine/threonine protein phosphatase 1
MTFVCADVHGCYDKYLKLLENIDFKDSDELYIIGDILDREGNGGIDILQDIMSTPNVRLILGNHEEIALEGMKFLMNTKIKNDTNIGELPEYIKVMLIEWINLGGFPTIDAFRELTCSEQERIVHFLSNRCLTYAEIAVNGTDYVLCHDENYYENVYDAVLITGHVPTRFLDDNPKPDYIWHDGEHWHIDCGCGYGGRLGAVCLETVEEFYVE